MGGPTVAVIGSFRRHYAEVLATLTTFESVGVSVTSPLGGAVIDGQVDFVRFDSDPSEWDDPRVQTVALHRILRATAVYVVAPEGYVGRTTCYEIGRCLQSRTPTYFSEAPVDLPIAVPDTHVLPPDVLAAYILEETVAPLLPLHDPELASLERRLLDGEYDER
ncbi:hypothetical protein [Microbacterium algeriense]|uniref:hypothetical protein n=1 Tax=Microbacterium algeriense TaxID=2615184 RepID=UPI0022E83921|nr:hypothetical protein [Microbacterium algeriense]